MADLVARCFLFLSNPIVRCLKLTPGCFIFCRGDVFRALGGFSQEMFAGEDADFGRRLWRWSRAHGLRMKILRACPPVTSLRKVELYGWKELLVLIARWVLFPRRTTRDKSCLRVFSTGGDKTPVTGTTSSRSVRIVRRIGSAVPSPPAEQPLFHSPGRQTPESRPANPKGSV